MKHLLGDFFRGTFLADSHSLIQSLLKEWGTKFEILQYVLKTVGNTESKELGKQS